MNRIFSQMIDSELSYTSLWLSTAMYCDPNTYLNRTYTSYTEGIIPTYRIFDERSDINGMIGISPANLTIFIVFRGSKSIENWKSDLDSRLVQYDKCQNCLVHDGFYSAAKSIFSDVIQKVTELSHQYSNYSIVVTGHSLGGALALLTSLELIHEGFSSKLRLINFGSPRVGNDPFAVYASSLLTSPLRYTHHKDSVPHLPLEERFMHISGEYYEDESGNIKACTGCEDIKCADQWYLTNINDHLNYFGLYISCDSVSQPITTNE